VDHVKIVIPTPDGPGSERTWAEPVDVAAGRYRIDNVLFFTDGVSLDDIVRCEPNATGELIAVEILERSSNATLTFAPDEEAMDEDGRNTACRRLISRIADRHGETVSCESGMGFVAVCATPELLDSVLDMLGKPRDLKERVPDRPGQVQAVHAAGGAVDYVTAFGQALLQVGGGFLLVLNHKDGSWHRSQPGLSPSGLELGAVQFLDVFG
jgi:hypothetical protein